MQAVVFIGYIGLGLFQLAAVMAGLEDWIGLHWIIAMPIAFLLAYTPVIGTVLGVGGAMVAWKWSWMQACALFFGPFVVIALIAISGGLLAKFSSRG